MTSPVDLRHRARNTLERDVDDTKRRVLLMFRDGSKTVDIARAVGRSEDSIARWLREMGIRRRQVSCSHCGKGQHDIRTCPEAPKRTGGFCETCAGLPWRRPRGIRKLCACNEAWSPEPTTTLADVLAMPRADRRTW